MQTLGHVCTLSFSLSLERERVLSLESTGSTVTLTWSLSLTTVRRGWVDGSSSTV